MNSRRLAVDVLEKVEEGGFASPIIDALPIDDRDRRFVRTVVMNVLRWRSRIDWTIERLAKRPVGKLHPPRALQLLRSGLAQVLYMEVPPHAAVNETVNLCVGPLSRVRGLVNAVMRGAVREGARDSAADDLATFATMHGHPEWIARRWAATFGEGRARAIIVANQQLSHSDLLVNERCAVEDVVEELSQRGIETRVSPLSRRVLKIEDATGAIADLIVRGDVYPMDEGSVAVARLVSAGAGDTVLDSCAAPGGKSLVLAQQGCRVISHDISLQRLGLLRRTGTRFMGRAPRIVVGDGRRPSFRGDIDTVFVDAPCSATGTIRRNPEIKWRLEASDLETFAALQKELLASALSVAAREVVYATCSLEPEENDHVVAEVLRHVAGWEIAPAVIEIGSPLAKYTDGPVLRLTPESESDGFTVHRLRRMSST